MKQAYRQMLTGNSVLPVYETPASSSSSSSSHSPAFPPPSHFLPPLPSFLSLFPQLLFFLPAFEQIICSSFVTLVTYRDYPILSSILDYIYNTILYTIAFYSRQDSYNQHVPEHFTSKASVNSSNHFHSGPSQDTSPWKPGRKPVIGTNSIIYVHD